MVSGGMVEARLATKMIQAVLLKASGGHQGWHRGGLPPERHWIGAK